MTLIEGYYHKYKGKRIEFTEDDNNGIGVVAGFNERCKSHLLVAVEYGRGWKPTSPKEENIDTSIKAPKGYWRVSIKEIEAYLKAQAENAVEPCKGDTKKCPLVKENAPIKEKTPEERRLEEAKELYKKWNGKIVRESGKEGEYEGVVCGYCSHFSHQLIIAVTKGPKACTWPFSGRFFDAYIASGEDSDLGSGFRYVEVDTLEEINPRKDLYRKWEGKRVKETAITGTYLGTVVGYPGPSVKADLIIKIEGDEGVCWPHRMPNRGDVFDTVIHPDDRFRYVNIRDIKEYDKQQEELDKAKEQYEKLGGKYVEVKRGDKEGARGIIVGYTASPRFSLIMQTVYGPCWSASALGKNDKVVIPGNAYAVYLYVDPKDLKKL